MDANFDVATDIDEEDLKLASSLSARFKKLQDARKMFVNASIENMEPLSAEAYEAAIHEFEGYTLNQLLTILIKNDETVWAQRKEWFMALSDTLTDSGVFDALTNVSITSRKLSGPLQSALPESRIANERAESARAQLQELKTAFPKLEKAMENSHEDPEDTLDEVLDTNIRDLIDKLRHSDEATWLSRPRYFTNLYFRLEGYEQEFDFYA